MSTEPSDYMASKRDRRDFLIMLDGVHKRVRILETAIVTLSAEIADLQERVERHHVPGQLAMLPTRVTAKQREALTYMAAHADLHLPPVVWQENGGFGGSVLPKLVEHGFVDRTSGNRYRINAAGLDYLSAEAAS